MFQRLSNWLRRFVDRVKHPGKSVQYELQRMTHKGGWENFYTDPNYDSADAFPTPPPQPSFDPDTGYPPGTYRCLKRVDGRINTIVWTVESPDADAYYDELRDQAATKAAAPSLEEVKEGITDGRPEPLIERLELARNPDTRHDDGDSRT